MATPPHALVIPYPAQGHVIPLMELSHCLLDHGFMITFVNTEFNHARMVASLQKMGGDNERIRLVEIPDGLAPGGDRNDVGKLCDSALSFMPSALEELIGRIDKSNDGNITCVIADASMACALEVGRKMGIRGAALWPASVSLLAQIFHIPKLIEDSIIDANDRVQAIRGLPLLCKDSPEYVSKTVDVCGQLLIAGYSSKHQMIKLSPTMPMMNTEHLFWLCINDNNVQQSLFRYANHINRALESADWLLCNSFHEIEQSAFELVPNILPIGPLLAGRRLGRLEGNFWREDSTCLSWLDKQPACSVIYVAFGSFTVFDQCQFQKLALGLELSGHPFLWVVRPDLTDGSSDAYPDGFKERVADRSLIVGWSPQQKVLAHPSIGCFLSHCGWNSTMEGLSNGVPFLCWPYFADQFLNKAYISDVWKVGLGFIPDGNGIIPREEIKGKLDELLGDDGIRARSLELMEMARKQVGEGGSSLKNFNSFIEAMKLEK